MPQQRQPPATAGQARAERRVSRSHRLERPHRLPERPALDRVHAEPPPSSCDIAIVGGGIVGLAVARELTRRHPRRSICVLERELGLATHQTGNNSGVVHTGIYYRPGSLQARLCVDGSRALYDFCSERRIAHERCGKLILATRPAEIARLEELHRRGLANGVRDLHAVEGGAIERIEPHARGLAGLHSPNTGVLDFRAVAEAFADDVLEAGNSVACGCAVHAVRPRARSLTLEHTRGSLQARHAIFCAGAWADRLAVAAGAPRDPRIVPFRGAYLRLRPERRHLVSSLIYPTPDPSLPFLGVHLTRRLDGEVLVGPTALISMTRDAHRQRSVRQTDLLETLAWPGTWRMLGRSGPAAVRELHRSVAPSALVRAAARLLPELEPGDVQPGFSGVRAQALARDGRLLDDFTISSSERALHLRNAPSPAASACLALARHLCDLAQTAFSI